MKTGIERLNEVIASGNTAPREALEEEVFAAVDTLLLYMGASGCSLKMPNDEKGRIIAIGTPEGVEKLALAARPMPTRTVQ